MARDNRFPFRQIVRTDRPRRDSEVLVIGLGRFGSALAETLVSLGHHVLGIDANADIVQDMSERLTHTAQADATSLRALNQLGARDFAVAVVGIGNDIEASILTTAALVDLEVPLIWAKAITESHGKILQRVGAHQVVFPEHDMGQRVADLVTGRMIDYIELDEGFALVETTAPADLVGVTLGASGIRQRYGVTVVCIKPSGQPFTYATPDTVIDGDAILLVAGEKHQAEAFANLT